MKTIVHNGACFIYHELEERFKYLYLPSYLSVRHYALFHYLFSHPLDLIMCSEGKVGRESKTECTHASFTKSLKILSILCKEITF